MKILVAGKDGQVGQALQAQAAKMPSVDLVALSRNELDITDAASVQAAIGGHKPDLVMNAAAYTAVDRAEDEENQAFLVNAQGPELLAAACEATDIPFLHISTDFVFDGKKKTPYAETDICAPLSVYGKSKLAGEVAVQKACAQHIILRTAWVFGGVQNFVTTMRRLAADRDKISVVADQYGGPTYTADIAAALLTISSRIIASDFDAWGIYHFSGAPSVSWYEFASYILSGIPTVTVAPIPTSDYPTPAMRPSNSVLDCTKIHQEFGIVPSDWKLALSQI